MKLTVLGSSPAIPRPERACSSYLIEAGGAAVVADLGSGAYANLVARRSPRNLDAILISHMHADHFLDLIPLRYALKYGAEPRHVLLPVYLPPGGEAMLRALCAAFHPETGDDFLGSVYDVREYTAGQPLTFGALRVHFAPTTHYIPCFAMRFEAGADCLVYSADTAPDTTVVEFARGAGLFLCEASLSQAAEADLPRGHSSVREAATMASTAAVPRLVLSHYPAAHEVAAMEREAQTRFSGEVSVADDGDVFEL